VCEATVSRTARLATILARVAGEDSVRPQAVKPLTAKIRAAGRFFPATRANKAPFPLVPAK